MVHITVETIADFDDIDRQLVWVKLAANTGGGSAAGGS
jgi:hypothetical protein